MITRCKIDSFELKANKRILKVLQFGTKTAAESAPFGDDAAPLKDMIAVFAETSNNSEPVVVGYINKNQIAGPGEKRIYSLKPDGLASADIYLKDDGTVEFHGSTKNMVRYQELETAFNQLKSDFNALVGKFNSHVHISAAPGSPNTPTNTAGTNSTADISPAKIENIKTN